MTTKPVDTRLVREMQELNRDFLALLLKTPAGRGAYGLDSGVLARLRALSDGQLDTIARCPVLLAGFSVPPPFPAPRLVAESRPGSEAEFRPVTGSGIQSATVAAPGQLPQRADSTYYTAALLNWLWQTARNNRLVATLAMGPGRETINNLAEAGFREISRATEMAPGLLMARFCRHPRFWPDLVRAAASPDPELMRITRLAAVQLTLVGRVPSAAAAARLAALRRQPQERPRRC
jgi:hypothetical protein